MPNGQTKSSRQETTPISWHLCGIGNYMASNAVKKKKLLAQVKVFKAYQITLACSMSAMSCLWVKIYSTHFFQIACPRSSIYL